MWLEVKDYRPNDWSSSEFGVILSRTQEAVAVRNRPVQTDPADFLLVTHGTSGV